MKYILSFFLVSMVITLISMGTFLTLKNSLGKDSNFNLLTAFYKSHSGTVMNFLSYLSTPRILASQDRLVSDSPDDFSKICAWSNDPIIIPSETDSLAKILESHGYSGSLAFRTKLAQKLGISDYQGSVVEDQILINLIRNDKNQSINCLLTSIWI